MSINRVGKRFAGILFTLILALGLATPALASFSYSSYQPARRVLGQPNFTSNSAATTRKGMAFPYGIAVDPTTHKVFVADSENNRVLRFASLYSLVNGAPAESVLGQTSYTTTVAATTRHGMFGPYHVFVDAAGRLWVADALNNRVLRFDHASTLGVGANASAVLGQPNFTSGAGATTRNGMRSPAGVFVDAAGRLWVADTSNSRVLRFNNAAAKANGANADGVLGQPNFTNGTSATLRNRMTYPYGVTVDGTGHLWVADTFSHRVLRFNNAAAKANGANADGVLGQPDFTSSTLTTTRKGMYEPFDVAADGSGHVYVADGANNRILIFSGAAGLANGANAAFVLGQNSFLSKVANFNGLSAKSLYTPVGVFYDPHAKVLFAVDTFNHRVLMYGTPTP